MSEPYQVRAAAKRAQQLSLIPEEWRLPDVPSVESQPSALEYIRSCPLLSAEELDVTETTDANVLLRKLASGELSSLAVVTAYAKRAAIAHQLTTCLTEIFFDEAMAEARRLDAIIEGGGEPVGPLHGLPVSIKDCMDIEGKDSTVGWVGQIGKPMPRDGHVARTLRRLGAVLYVKTNVPQSMMMSDSYNHVFGQCVNPHNRALISGGSSGGESALIGARGSVLGFGSDIGGSIRIPAGVVGVYGLFTSLARQPFERDGHHCQRVIDPVAGPLASSLETIETYMEALARTDAWEFDPKIAPIPWRRELCSVSGSRRLRIGFITDDGRVRPQPPAVRAVEEVAEALRSAGHEVTEWDASDHGYAYDIWEKIILSDGGLACRKLCEMSGEPLVEGMLVGTDKNLLSTEELHKITAAKYDYEKRYLERWSASGLDALIMPVAPWVGYKPWTWVKSNQYVGYTSIWNLVDWPALTVPVTTVTEEKDGSPGEDWTSHQGRNPGDVFNKEQYDVGLVKGMPVSIQVVAGKYGDERCIAVAKVIRDLLKA